MSWVDLENFGTRAVRLLDRVASPVIDIRGVASSLLEIPWFLGSYFKYWHAARERPKILDLHPSLHDRKARAGVASGDYFHQDLWAARKVFDSCVQLHFDVASRVDGFVAHCAVFTKVVYIDLRSLPGDIPNIETRLGRLGQLPLADGSVHSLSCLHVVEHPGLGRYGDPIDPEGTFKALSDLKRVLALQGNLYLGVPIGRERVCFNSHRIVSPDRIMDAMVDLDLVDFAAVDAKGCLLPATSPSDFRSVEYSCGLFHFRRTSPTVSSRAPLITLLPETQQTSNPRRALKDDFTSPKSK